MATTPNHISCYNGYMFFFSKMQNNSFSDEINVENFSFKKN